MNGIAGVPYTPYYIPPKIGQNSVPSTIDRHEAHDPCCRRQILQSERYFPLCSQFPVASDL